MEAPHSTPSATAALAALEQPAAASWQERAYAALPLFLVGLAFLAATFDLYFSGAATSVGKSGGARIATWELFLALAVTGLSAGIFTLFVDTHEEAAEVPDGAPTPTAAITPVHPESVPEWDESQLPPEPGLPLPKRLWELDPFTSEGHQATSPSDDAVMHQLDEIEASLRKKSRPSQ